LDRLLEERDKAFQSSVELEQECIEVRARMRGLEEQNDALTKRSGGYLKVYNYVRYAMPANYPDDSTAVGVIEELREFVDKVDKGVSSALDTIQFRKNKKEHGDQAEIGGSSLNFVHSGD
jgi:hypothetical protein